MFNTNFVIPLCLIVATSNAIVAAAAEPVSFNEQIRPILADRCFKCHGPDSATREAGLRLDQETAAKSELDDTGNIPIVAGQPDESELFARLVSTDPDAQMPPPDSKLAVTHEEIALIRQWIEAGAQWQRHWAFIAPVKSELPTVEDRSWPLNEIDNFILQRLEAAGLQPTRPADRERLLRRVTFALTGLPPTLAELDAFLSEETDQAYEEAVDRLLRSPAFGERMAQEWLDVARYGDTDGLFEDHPRSIYPWRDWVIDAFNNNLAYNDFITWQLAGDLLPGATISQRVATGFLRNNPTSNEGGIIDEDYRVKYLVDRVNTTATAFLGLTLECAQCHDHKYDPMTQREYYQFAGFFNSLEGQGNTKGATSPTLRLYSPEQRTRMATIDQQLAKVDAKLTSTPAELNADFEAWLEEISQPVKWQSPQLAANTSFQIKEGWIHKIVDPVLASKDVEKAGSQDALPADDAEVKRTPQTATLSLLLQPGPLTALQIESQRPNPIEIVDAKLVSEDEPTQGKPFRFDGDTKLTLKQEPAVIGIQSEVTVGKGQWLELTLRSTDVSGFRIATTSNATVALRAKLGQDRDKRLAFFRDQWPGFKSEREQKAQLSKEKKDIEVKAPLTMIAGDMAKPRANHVLMRGEYDKRGDVVQTAAPASIMAFGDDLPKSRLGLARWLTHRDQPLTAQVVVNRYWQMIFGVGIVKTSEDFGTQGHRPSHEKLLDYLAVDFIESGWDVKALVRKLVLSATYRQASMVTPQVAKLDPENRLLSHAPRRRLQAEFIRDHVLSVSGLLVNKQGGAGVRPYQPVVLFGRNAIGAAGTKFSPDTGASLYRRSLYTYWKRQIPAANMRILGADGRTTCRTRRERTNTPLQALVLLNDPQFVEAARALAERAIRKGGPQLNQRLSFAFRLATSRRPRNAELDILRQEYADRLLEFQTNAEAAAKYLAGGGESKPLEQLDRAELAALAAVASLILNLDESISAS